ncbi:UDP-forming cellulose synthase catalytic subunit [Rhodopseudomonas sp.]|uniref:UDP-forming cellulose synthase catalytic subunit n=1 Tax=Rhodopseudomonas sp. TaxID=1078 RepID=UPI0025EB36AC|nr:UDP-forming cellulose synthase catalytic subunit [Rhodopseudomonas sp.]
MARSAGWAAALAMMVAFVAQPISVSAQSTLAIFAIVVMAAIWRFASGALARTAFLATGSLVVLRYVYWRASSTLPSIDEPLSFVFGIILFAAELYCVGFLAINLVINADPLVRKAATVQSDESLPSVDVFVPSYNEDHSILAATLSAAVSLDYPRDKLTVWLLDDGGTNQKCNDSDRAKAALALQRRIALKAMCERLGVSYLTRERNEHAKAGNLNAGLNASKGEIVVVFDADHVPFRSFLRETIGYFAEDPRLFLVQTPHVFLNPDPIERNLQTFDRMPSENEMFYSITQRGLDKWNGSFFCGSAALLRRAALLEAGGFSGVTITEDCETAFELHAKGWTSLYVDKPLIAGLQPETFESFIGQRSRWCQGMFQIMLLKNPALKRGLAPIQRLAYLSSMMFWMFPLPRLIFMFAPLLHIFFDVRIFSSSIDETVAYTASYMVVNVMFQSYLFGRVRWPWMSELYEYVQGMYLLGAIVSVVMSPRKPTFNVTAKGLSLDRDHLSALALPFVAAFLLLASGVATAAYRYAFEAGTTNLMLVVGLWSATNLLVAGVALGVVAERGQADCSSRLDIDRTGTLSFADRAIDVAIHNVSASGCLIRTSETEALDQAAAAGSVGSLTVVALDGRPSPAPIAVRLVQPNGENDANGRALSFDQLQTEQYLGLAELMYGDGDAMTRFLASRRDRMTFLQATLQFILWGFEGPVRALLYWQRGRAAPPIAVVETRVEPANVAAPALASAGPIDEIEQDVMPSSAPSAPIIHPAFPACSREPMYDVWMQSMLALAAEELRKASDQDRAAGAALRVA